MLNIFQQKLSNINLWKFKESEKVTKVSNVFQEKQLAIERHK